MKHLLLMLFVLPAMAAASEWTSRPLGEIALYPEFRATARIEAVDESRLAPEIAGRIEALPVRVGTRVAKGAELARIDTADYRIAADRATAQVRLVESRLQLAQAQLEQSLALAGRGFISDEALRVRRTELAVLQSELAAARQALAAARLALSRTVIRAPFAGVVRERLASVGELATPGMPLLVLASTDEAEVHARVPTAQVEGLEAAGAWTLWVGEAAHPLQLVRVLSVVEAAGQARIVVFSAPVELAPGLGGEVRWRAVQPHLAPDFIVERSGRRGVWVERNGAPEFVELPGAAVGRPVPVDWPAQTRIVEEGRFGLGVPPAPVQGDAR